MLLNLYLINLVWMCEPPQGLRILQMIAISISLSISTNFLFSRFLGLALIMASCFCLLNYLHLPKEHFHVFAWRWYYITWQIWFNGSRSKFLSLEFLSKWGKKYRKICFNFPDWELGMYFFSIWMRGPLSGCQSIIQSEHYSYQWRRWRCFVRDLKTLLSDSTYHNSYPS